MLSVDVEIRLAIPVGLAALQCLDSHYETPAHDPALPQCLTTNHSPFCSAPFAVARHATRSTAKHSTTRPNQHRRRPTSSPAQRPPAHSRCIMNHGWEREPAPPRLITPGRVQQMGLRALSPPPPLPIPMHIPPKRHPPVPRLLRTELRRSFARRPCPSRLPRPDVLVSFHPPPPPPLVIAKSFPPPPLDASPPETRPTT